MSQAHVVFGILVVIGSALGAVTLARTRRPLSWFGSLALAAVALRILGSLLRHLVITGYYRGLGDAIRYYQDGLGYAQMLLGFDLGSFFDTHGAQWWGTQAIIRTSGIILSIIGPSIRAEFVVFALIGFLGCLAFILAYHRSGPGGKRASRTYVLMMCLWPSLWFWPSSIGKEAILLAALGLSVLGYVGRNGKIRWIPFGLGMLLVFTIRPHVATVLGASVLISEWFGVQRRFTLARAFQAVASIIIFILVLQRATEQFGFEPTDLEGATEFFQFRSGQTQTGGSEIAAAGSGLIGVLMAYVNILFRPFLFEAHNVMALFSALEMTTLWIIAWRRRRNIARALRNWRSDRFLRIGLPMTVLYVLMIGLTFSNLGIIARQRVLVLPFLFAIVAGRPAERRPKPERRGRKGRAVLVPITPSTTEVEPA